MAGDGSIATLRVVIADDQTTVREALARMLALEPRISVAGVASNGAELVELVDRTTPDVVLTDLRMPTLDGASATRRLTESFPDLAVVVLTTFDDSQSVLAAMAAGARGYLTKDSGLDDIVAALHTAVAGQTILDPNVRSTIVSAAVSGVNHLLPAPTDPEDHRRATRNDVTDSRVELLTGRERQVLQLMCAGCDNREIATRLYIGSATVKTHINRLFAKIGVRNRDAAKAFALTAGLA